MEALNIVLICLVTLPWVLLAVYLAEKLFDERRSNERRVDALLTRLDALRVPVVIETPMGNTGQAPAPQPGTEAWEYMQDSERRLRDALAGNGADLESILP